MHSVLEVGSEGLPLRDFDQGGSLLQIATGSIRRFDAGARAIH